MDFAKVTVKEMRDAARAAGIDPSGKEGKTSWLVQATRAEIERALSAKEARERGDYQESEESNESNESGAENESLPGTSVTRQEERKHGEAKEETREEMQARMKAIADAMRAAAREEIRKHLAAKRTVIVKEDADGKRGEEIEVGTVHRIFPEVIALLRAGLSVYLYGPPGVGKTHLCEQVAIALERSFHADSFTPQTSDWRVSGYKSVTDGAFIATPFYHAVTSGGLYLGDEIDKASDGVVGAFNLALSNNAASFACGLIAKHPNARFVFAGNTVGLGATPMYPDRSVLPADFRDRFVFVHMPVDERLERTLALARNENASEWIDYVQATRARVERAGLPLVVSPRASMNGATLLTLGYSMTDVADRMLWRGAPESMVRRAKGE